MRQKMQWLIVVLISGVVGIEVDAATPDVESGDRVRIQMSSLQECFSPAVLEKEKISPFVSGYFVIGRVEAIDRTTMMIRPEGGDSTASVSMQDVDELEVWSRGTHKTSGTLLGLLGGVILGGTIGHSMERDEASATGSSGVTCNSYFCEGSYEADFDLGPSPALQGAVLGGLIGAVVGRLIGSSMNRDQWNSVDLHTFRARVVTRGDESPGLVCSISF